MKIIEIVNSVPVLREISVSRIKISTGHKLRKILDELSPIADDYSKQREELIKKFGGVLNETKSMYEFKKGQQEKLEVELKALGDDEIKIKKFNKIPVVEIENIEIEAFRLPLIDFVIDYGKE